MIMKKINVFQLSIIVLSSIFLYLYYCNSQNGRYIALKYYSSGSETGFNFEDNGYSSSTHIEIFDTWKCKLLEDKVLEKSK